jgi:hypothetical protein
MTDEDTSVAYGEPVLHHLLCTRQRTPSRQAGRQDANDLSLGDLMDSQQTHQAAETRGARRLPP